jgi:beta-glucosidase
MKGTYPEAFVGGNPLDKMGVRAGDMELVKAPLDFFGMNYYQRTIIAAAGPDKNRPGVELSDSGGTDGPKTDMGWEIWPDGFYELLMRIAREYKNTPMEVTENGASYLDGPDAHGKIPDTQRVEYLRGYLSALGRAMKDGANVRGYHGWSLLDNFEWAEGYTQRFGLVYVDFHDQRRIIKESGEWYGKLADTGNLK